MISIDALPGSITAATFKRKYAIEIWYREAEFCKADPPQPRIFPLYIGTRPMQIPSPNFLVACYMTLYPAMSVRRLVSRLVGWLVGRLVGWSVARSVPFLGSGPEGADDLCFHT